MRPGTVRWEPPMPAALQRSRECLGPDTQTRLLTRAPFPGFGTSLQRRPRIPSWPQSEPNTGRRTMSASSTSYLSLISSLETHRGRSAASTADGLPGHCSPIALALARATLVYLTKLALPTGEILGMPMENFKGNARVSDASGIP